MQHAACAPRPSTSGEARAPRPVVFFPSPSTLFWSFSSSSNDAARSRNRSSCSAGHHTGETMIRISPGWEASCHISSEREQRRVGGRHCQQQQQSKTKPRSFSLFPLSFSLPFSLPFSLYVLQNSHLMSADGINYKIKQQRHVFLLFSSLSPGRAGFSLRSKEKTTQTPPFFCRCNL